MGAIRETLTLEDRFSATFTRFLNLGTKATNASKLASSAAANYQSVLNSVDRKLISANAQFEACFQEQQKMVAANQQNTAAFANLDARMEKLGGTIRDLTAQYDLLERQAGEAAEAADQFSQESQKAASATKSAKNATDKFSKSQKAAINSTNSLTSAIKRLVGSYLGLRGLKELLDLSDTMASTTARLDMMNDGLQTTDQLNQKIYESAIRSRGAYLETANFVAKLGNLAGDAFSGNDEIIAFAEQINKQIVLSGASSTEASSAIYQLTQGLSAGALRGEELNSVMEQTPMIAQTIADYLGKSTGELREFASEGKLTAGIVKNALLSAAEETNAAFEKMPITWGQVFTQAKNMEVQALQPLLGFISSLAGQAMDILSKIPEWISEHSDIIVAALGTIAVAMTALTVKAAVMAGAFMLAHAPLIAVIGLVSAFIYGLTQAGVTAETVFSYIGQMVGFFYAFFGNIVVGLYNLWASFAEFFANVFNDPIKAITRLFFDFVDGILGMLENVGGAIDAVFGWLGSNVSGTVREWRDGLKQWVDDAVGENAVKIDRMENINYEDAISQFGQYGADFGKSLADTLSGFGTSVGVGSAGQLDYTQQMDSISKGVNNIAKSVDVSQEDIQSLVDIAERRYVNNINLTSQTPVINISGQNTGNTAADRRNLANTIRDILVEQLSAGSVRTTSRAF